MGGKDSCYYFHITIRYKRNLGPIPRSCPTPTRAGIHEEKCHTEWDQGKLGDSTLTSKKAHEKKFDKKFHST